MIFDHINNLDNYNDVAKNIKKFTDYVRAHDISGYEPGKYVIDEDVFFTVKCYEARLPEKAGWESHREYIDIQYLIEGRELMGIMPISQLREKTPYDPVLDKTVYEPSDYESILKLRPGMFALLLPQDAHHPTIIDGELTHNKKAVVKIRV